MAGPPPIPPANLKAKRRLDLGLGLTLMVLLSPLFWLIWLAYLLAGRAFPEDRGPAFHKVLRNSQGRVIKVYKFRLSRMARLRELAGQISAAEIDLYSGPLSPADRDLIRRRRSLLVEDMATAPTRLGGLLKKVYLDELPQLFNIVLGTMSLVGPRPLPLSDPRVLPDPAGLVTLGGRRFDYRHRDLLPAGLTGLYQLNKTHRAKEDYGRFIQEGVAKDLEYCHALRSATPWGAVRGDLEIIAGTLKIVLAHEGI